MTDNVNITPGVGALVAADDVGGVLFQRVKVTWGPDGTANDADTASGKGLPVQIRDSSGSELAVSGNPFRIDPTGTTPQPASQSGTWDITDISGTISLPTGAATAANQTAVQGTTGGAVPSRGTLVQGSDGTNARNLSTTSAGVLKVDVSATAGNSTAIKVDGSAVAQPVSPSLKTTSSLTNANVSISSSGENTVVAGTALQTIRVFRGSFVAASAVTMTVKNAASGTTLATIPLSANQAFSFDTFESGEPLWLTSSGGAFIVSLGSAVSVSGFVQYTKS